MTENKIQLDEEKANEDLDLRYQNDIFQEGKLQVADEVLSPDFVIHNSDLLEELRKGAEGIKKYASALIAAVSDRNLVQDDVFAKGDKVLIRWSNSGTSIGPLLDHKPTGKRHVATGFDVFRILNRKIAELWQQKRLENWP